MSLWKRNTVVDAPLTRENEDLCIHGHVGTCMRCAMEEMDLNPGASYVSLDKEDLERVVLTMPETIASRMRMYPQVVLAGGFIRATIAGERPADLDLFYPRTEKGDMRAREEAQNVLPWSELKGSDRAYTYTPNLRGQTPEEFGYPVQIIWRWEFPNAYTLMNSFDFTICKAGVWYDPDKKAWQGACHKQFYTDLAAKRIVYAPSAVRPDTERNVVSIARIMKFVSRGYYVSPEQLALVVADSYQCLKSDPKDMEAVMTELREVLARSHTSDAVSMAERSAPYVPPKKVKPRVEDDWGS